MKATKNTGSITMPAGRYWLGDPCYSVPDDRWMEWLKAARFDEPDGRRFLLAELDGYPVMAIGTAHGDGEYPGSDGFSYPVDAGLIGLVPVELVPEGETPFGARTETFDSTFTCTYEEEGGVIVLGHIEIKTDWDDDEDYEDEEIDDA